MGQGGAKGIILERPDTYIISDYEKFSNVPITDGSGQLRKEHPHSQRYDYLNFNSSRGPSHNYGDDIDLRNVVTTTRLERKIEVIEPPKSHTQGGLYFEHGYDAYLPTDIVSASGYENVDLDTVARTLIDNQSFVLKITAHADTSGDTAKNQTLSERRLDTAKTLLVAALQRQGLSEVDSQKIFETRVAPYASIVASGEKAGPVATEDDTKHQGNRVVTFDLITQTKPTQSISTDFHKRLDADNHEHTVIVNMGPRKTQKEVNFDPANDTASGKPGQFTIPDENINFIFKLDPQRQLNAAHQFAVNYWAKTNLVADNTDFLIENDTPGAVTSAYNFETGEIDVSVDGQVAVNIRIRNNIDPAVIRVGQVTSQGEVRITPLTNLADVRPISEARNIHKERNVLNDVAESIVQLSIEAKHLYIANTKDRKDDAGYLKALEQSGFTQKLDKALEGLVRQGVDVTAFRQIVVNQYAEPQSSLYHPDVVMFPFQTYQGIYESVVSSGAIPYKEDANAYKTVLDYLKSQETLEQRTPTKDAPERTASTIFGIKNN